MCPLQNIVAIAPELDAIVLMLCDQPFVSSHLIRQLIVKHTTSQYPIICSEYAGVLGVPALFYKTFFPELGRLQGDVGAKAIIRQHYSHCLSIPFAEGSIDLDVPEDLKGIVLTKWNSHPPDASAHSAGISAYQLALLPSPSLDTTPNT